MPANAEALESPLTDIIVDALSRGPTQLRSPGAEDAFDRARIRHGNEVYEMEVDVGGKTPETRTAISSAINILASQISNHGYETSVRPNRTVAYGDSILLQVRPGSAAALT